MVAKIKNLIMNRIEKEKFNIIKIEPSKGDTIDWCTPFFTEDYIPQKVEVFNLEDFIK